MSLEKSAAPSPSEKEEQEEVKKDIEEEKEKSETAQEAEEELEGELHVFERRGSPTRFVTPNVFEWGPQRRFYGRPRRLRLPRSYDLEPSLAEEDPQYAIDFGRVLSGEETRTTIMIRNIPNKMRMEALILILNSCLLGMVDFVFMPMDLRRPRMRTNLGYAFVNLCFPRAALPMANHMHGLYWPGSNSRKKCYLCYAKVQGLTDLIERVHLPPMAFPLGRSVGFPTLAGDDLNVYFRDRFRHRVMMTPSPLRSDAGSMLRIGAQRVAPFLPQWLVYGYPPSATPAFASWPQEEAFFAPGFGTPSHYHPMSPAVGLSPYAPQPVEEQQQPYYMFSPGFGVGMEAYDPNFAPYWAFYPPTPTMPMTPGYYEVGGTVYAFPTPAPPPTPQRLLQTPTATRRDASQRDSDSGGSGSGSGSSSPRFHSPTRSPTSAGHRPFELEGSPASPSHDDQPAASEE